MILLQSGQKKNTLNEISSCNLVGEPGCASSARVNDALNVHIILYTYIICMHAHSSRTFMYSQDIFTIYRIKRRSYIVRVRVYFARQPRARL